MIEEDKEILRIKSTEDSLSPIKIQWHDSEGRAHGIVLNKQKEAEEHDLLVARLSESTRPLNVSKNHLPPTALYYCSI